MILSVLAACSAHVLVAGPSAYFRTPSLDSSYVQSNRLGGSFAYHTVSSPAYQAVTPLAYAAYPAHYPTYNYLQYPFVGPAPSFGSYQPAFFEQRFGFAPGAQTPGLVPAAAAPATDREPESNKEEMDDGQQIDDDTVSVDSA